ncbi:MAG: hypothetical protein SGJ18_03010 [Pseudomonadota bacterium]|nr:hypothetical protein [Pseudomonadota bacterium]
MKKIMLVAAIAVMSSVASATVCPPGGVQFSCTDTANLVISGQVAAICNIEVVPELAAAQLNIVGGEANTKVATVTEQSNSPAGYLVSVSSANNGKLVHSTLPGNLFGYQVSYDGGAAISPLTTPTQVKASGALPGFTTDTSDVNVTFPAQASAVFGTYSDTLTFTIQAL